jgi:hypothetical protein
MIDGFPFERSASGDLARLRSLAAEMQAELWMTAVTHRESLMDERGVPEPLADLQKDVDVILRLAHDTRAVHVSLLKDHDNPDVSDLRLALDPTTMLLKRER